MAGIVAAFAGEDWAPPPSQSTIVLLGAAMWMGAGAAGTRVAWHSATSVSLARSTLSAPEVVVRALLDVALAVAAAAAVATGVAVAAGGAVEDWIDVVVAAGSAGGGGTVGANGFVSEGNSAFLARLGHGGATDPLLELDTLQLRHDSPTGLPWAPGKPASGPRRVASWDS